MAILSRQALLGELIPGINKIFGDILNPSPLYLDESIMDIVNKGGDIDELRERLCRMMKMEQQDLGLSNVWRLEIVGDLFQLNDFTLPSNNDIIKKLHRRDQVPTWMLESLAVMQILDDQTLVDDVGHKINGTIYYLIEPKD